MNISGQRDLLIFIVQLLSRHQIEYLLTGSFAVSYYGIPRATHDIDFIVEVTSDSVTRFQNAMKSLGKAFVVDIQRIESAAKEHSLFNIYHLETGIKIDFWIIDADDFHQKKKRSVTVPFDTQNIHFISAEDLILNKLVWCREVMSERHMRDCVGIVEIQREKLDANICIAGQKT